jgi:hypothetical protein
VFRIGSKTLKHRPQREDVTESFTLRATTNKYSQERSTKMPAFKICSSTQSCRSIMQDRRALWLCLSSTVPQDLTSSQPAPSHPKTPLDFAVLSYDVLEQVIEQLDRVSLYMLRQTSAFFFRSRPVAGATISAAKVSAGFPLITRRDLFMSECLIAGILLRGRWEDCKCAVAPGQGLHSVDCREWLMCEDGCGTRHELWADVFLSGPLGRALKGTSKVVE